MTQSLRIESRVGKDGILTLRVPMAPSEADTEVIVTIRPKEGLKQPEGESAWPSGYFAQTYGSLADDPVLIPDDPLPTPEGMD